jgi:hypothetical protein
MFYLIAKLTGLNNITLKLYVYFFAKVNSTS